MPQTLEPVKQHVSGIIRELRSSVDSMRIRHERNPEMVHESVADFLGTLTTKLDTLNEIFRPLFQIDYDITDSDLRNMFEKQLVGLQHRNQALKREILRRKRQKNYYTQKMHESVLQKRLLQTITESTTTGIAVIDGKNFMVRWSNSAMLAFLNEPLRSSGIIGRSLEEVIPGASEIGLIEHCREVMKTRLPRLDTEFTYVGFGEGTTYWDRRISPLPTDGHTDIILELKDITEHVKQRKRFETLAAEHEKQRTMLDLIMDRAPTGLAFLDESGRYVLINQALADMHRVPVQDHMGKTVRDILPAMADVIEGLFRYVLSTGRTIVDYEIEYESKNRPGEQLFVLLSIYPVLNRNKGISGLGVIANDITLRKQAQLEADKKQRFTRTIIDAIPANIAVIDNDGKIVEVSRQWLNYASKHNARPSECGIGVNYLNACLRSMPGTPDAKKAYDGIKSVLAKEIPSFDLEYMVICDSKKESFLMRAVPVEIDHGGALIAHFDITERRKVDEALRISEERLRLAIEAAQIGTWDYDPNTYTVNRSQRTLDMYCLSQNLPQTPENIYLGVHPDDLEYVKTQVEKALAPGSDGHYEAEFRILLPDGTVKWIAEKGRAFFEHTGRDSKANRLIGICMDITEPKRAQQELAFAKEAAEKRAEEAHIAKTILDALMTQVPEGIIIVSAPDLVIQKISNHALNITGFSIEKIQSAPIYEVLKDWRILHADTRQPLDPEDIPLAASARKGTIIRNLELISVCPDGKEFYMLCSAGPLKDLNGNITGAVLVFVDITDRKQAQRRLEDLKNMLEEKNIELESILGVASHDLRSPLVNIKGFSGELAESVRIISDVFDSAQLPPDTRELLKPVFESDIPDAINYIQNSASTIDQILNGLLRVARAGLASLNLKKLDMNQIIKQVIDNVEFKLKEAGVIISVDNLPSCTGDQDQVLQIFSNLVDNAIKYIDPFRPGKIHITGSRTDDTSCFCIEDNGRGIAPEHKEKIFQIFYRTEPGSAKGEGLGLTIVRRIVDRHNGRIWVESEFGKGSRFFVELPV